MYVPDLRIRHYLILGTGMLLYILLGRRILDLLKSRITYPRTGYVQPPEKTAGFSSDTLTTLDLQPVTTRKENVTSFERRTAIVIFFFLSSPWEGSPRWFVPALIAALAATLYVLNRNSERPYPWGWALVLALLGLAPLLTEVPGTLQPMLLYLLVGLWLVAQGAWTLVNYLRTNPYPTTAQGVQA
jgi:hypothetical protein